MKNRIKLDDIAKKVGVSKMTVSLALRGDTSISTETVNTIKRVAAELGYTPNRIAKSLAQGRTYTIAVIVGGMLHDDYHNQFLRGAIGYAMEHGYTMTIGLVEGGSRHEASLIEKYRQMMVDGFLAFHCGDSENYRMLQKSQIPFVLYTKYFHDLDCDYVVCDDFKGGYMMAKYLISLGHKSIGFVFDKNLKNSSEVINRINGYKQAIIDAGGVFNTEMLLPYNIYFDSANGIKNNQELISALHKPDSPTALFVCNDVVTSSLYTLLKAIGMKIPEDVSVTGYEGVYLGTILDPPLTTVSTPINELGRTACKVLIDKIEGQIPIDEAQKISLEPVLLIRNSTRRI